MTFGDAVIEVVHGDCLDVFRGREGLGAVVSDFPSGTGFMGSAWDRLPATQRDRPLAREDAFSEYWAERLRVAHRACVEDAVALIWALPRTLDLTMRALRLADWRIQDVIVHLFGQGWPKNKAALKPGQEMWILARKGSPKLGIDGCRVRRNWAERGEAWLRSGHSAKPDARKISGAPPGNGIAAHPLGSWPTNILLSHAEGCRRAGWRDLRATRSRPSVRGATALGLLNDDGWKAKEGVAHTFGSPDGSEIAEAWACLVACDCGEGWLALADGETHLCPVCGRTGVWACPVADLDAQGGERPSGARAPGVRKGLGYGGGAGDGGPSIEASTGGAARFFPNFGYYAKPPKGERHAGCDGLLWRVEKKHPFGFEAVTREVWETLSEPKRAQGNVHPTVKRIALLRWLHQLAAPNGPIADLSAGSCTGAIAAYLDGFDWVGAELLSEAIRIGEARLAFWRGLAPSTALRFLEYAEIPQTTRAPAEQTSLFDENS